jgi:hypothetical protein
MIGAAVLAREFLGMDGLSLLLGGTGHRLVGHQGTD